MNAPAADPSRLRTRVRPIVTTTLWGLFCACSWTWCIGMFLPVLMLDRFGIPGFVAFAVPNVLGCVAFGYVLNRARCRALREGHGTAMVAFSLVAVAFHMFFIAMLFSDFALAPEAASWLPMAASGVVFVTGAIFAVMGNRGWLVLAAFVYAFSVAAFAIVGLEAADAIEALGARDAGGLAWLAPVVIIGFLLCPYLDLTFHRAREAAPSRHAFAVFGVAFAVMIVFTAFLWFSPSPVLRGVGLGHLVAQSIFTVGAHLREVRVSSAIPGRRHRRMWALLPLAAAATLPIARLFSDASDLGDDVYIRFLVFYSLVFPAYVLLFMGPWRPLPLTRRMLLTGGLVVLVLAPLCEIGFVHAQAPALAIPAAAVAAWAIARRERR